MRLALAQVLRKFGDCITDSLIHHCWRKIINEIWAISKWNKRRYFSNVVKRSSLVINTGMWFELQYCYIYMKNKPLISMISPLGKILAHREIFNLVDAWYNHKYTVVTICSWLIKCQSWLLNYICCHVKSVWEVGQRLGQVFDLMICSGLVRSQIVHNCSHCFINSPIHHL